MLEYYTKINYFSIDIISLFNFQTSKNVFASLYKVTTINYELVKEYHENAPKRICLKTCHKNALRDITYADNIGALYLPFKESIKPIFEMETSLALIGTNSGRYWRPINNETDYDTVKKFKQKYDEIVFLRDALDISIALSENMADDGERTMIGELEYQAKFHNCEDSYNKIIDCCVDFIKGAPFYREAPYICAVPSSKVGKWNTPMIIAEEIATKLHTHSLCEAVCWEKDKKGLKELPFEEKWPLLETTGIKISEDIKDKDIILVDDLYQSGTTIQFVAMKLKEAGCKRVYGLSIVKARRDSDNQ